MSLHQAPPPLPKGKPGDPLSVAAAARDTSIIENVRQALDREKAFLLYQPVVDARRTGTVAFYEGLIRIMDDTGRVIPAKEFITQVEDRAEGRIIDCLALKLGLETLAKRPDIRLSINMSARSIGYARWNQILDRGLKTDPTAAERLILEITESSAILVPELVTSFMSRLQQRGISFALDDFGSGYTSFRYLKQFYFDILKIDGQYIRGISQDADNQILTRALASIAEQFDMVAVAESVETAEDALYLQQIGMDCMQGYFFGAPTVHPPWDLHAKETVRA